MTNAEFKILLKEVFNTHSLMNGRNYHTINELMHCLRYDTRLWDLDINISVIKANGEYCCIPAIDAFIDINTLSIWFDDDTVEYETEEIFGIEEDTRTIDCITIYEREEK